MAARATVLNVMMTSRASEDFAGCNKAYLAEAGAFGFKVVTHRGTHRGTTEMTDSLSEVGYLQVGTCTNLTDISCLRLHAVSFHADLHLSCYQDIAAVHSQSELFCIVASFGAMTVHCLVCNAAFRFLVCVSNAEVVESWRSGAQECFRAP